MPSENSYKIVFVLRGGNIAHAIVPHDKAEQLLQQFLDGKFRVSPDAEAMIWAKTKDGSLCVVVKAEAVEAIYTSPIEPEDRALQEKLYKLQERIVKAMEQEARRGEDWKGDDG